MKVVYFVDGKETTEQKYQEAIAKRAEKLIKLGTMLVPKTHPDWFPSTAMICYEEPQDAPKQEDN